MSSSPSDLHTTPFPLRRLAVHYPEDVIAGILNRQGRKTPTVNDSRQIRVGSLHRYGNIPRYEPPAGQPTGQIVPIRQAAKILSVNTSTVHRWLNDGFIAGEQLTPGHRGGFVLPMSCVHVSWSKHRQTICPCSKPR